MDAAPLTRRQVLASGAVGLLPASAGCISTDRSQASLQFENWTPKEGSWPLPWYDLQNTSYNSTASLPRSDVETSRTVDVDVDMRDVLLADDYLVVYGNGARVFDRTQDSPIWGTDDPVFVAAFGPATPDSEFGRTLYLATEAEGGQDATVTALGLRDGGSESLFSTTIEGQNVASILPTESALFVGSRGVDCFVFDAETGDRIAALHGRHGALEDGDLVTTTYGRVSAYETTELFSDGEPKSSWTEADFEGRAYHPAMANGRVLVGSFGTTDGSATGHLYCFDAETGDQLWEPESFGWATWTPAIDGDVGYVAGNDPESGTGRVAAVDLGDGSTLWGHDLDWQAIEPIAAGNGVVLVRHDGRPDDETPGYVEAFDGDSGETLWSFELETGIRRVRAVGETVYLVTDDTLYALESA